MALPGMGTIVNVGAVIAGGLIGLFAKRGIKKSLQEALMQALGLATIFIGAGGALKGMLVLADGGLDTQGTMLMILSIVLGALAGELIAIEDRLARFGEWLKQKAGAQKDGRFVDGFVTASLIICTGAMAVIGSMEDGLRGDPSMLLAKSTLDFVLLIILGASMGPGVLFSAIPMGLYQGGITVFAHLIEPILSPALVSDLSFVGSILIFCVGVNLSFGTKFKVGNLLPALLAVIAWHMVLLLL